MVNLDGSGSNIPGTATINWLNTDSVAVNSNTSWMTDMEEPTF
ncbi:MAG: hypothetical protein R2769_17290 [Saprospiraceae bacterium]